MSTGETIPHLKNFSIAQMLSVTATSVVPFPHHPKEVGTWRLSHFFYRGRDPLEGYGKPRERGRLQLFFNVEASEITRARQTPAFFNVEASETTRARQTPAFF